MNSEPEKAIWEMSARELFEAALHGRPMPRVDKEDPSETEPEEPLYSQGASKVCPWEPLES